MSLQVLLCKNMVLNCTAQNSMQTIEAKRNNKQDKNSWLQGFYTSPLPRMYLLQVLPKHTLSLPQIYVLKLYNTEACLYLKVLVSLLLFSSPLSCLTFLCNFLLHVVYWICKLNIKILSASDCFQYLICFITSQFLTKIKCLFLTTSLMFRTVL